MNKIYKIVWSKVKNCYVVVSELAKSHTKAPASRGINRALVVGVLACILSCGTVMPVKAYEYDMGQYRFYSIYEVTNWDEAGSDWHGYGLAIDKNTGAVYTGLGNSSSGGDGGVTITSNSLGSLNGVSYTAGNGITISSDNKVSVKPGTNVTVDGNGVSVNGNGSVGSGDTGLISGDTAYTELRSSANGNYVIQLELYNFISSFPLFSSFLTIP